MELFLREWETFKLSLYLERASLLMNSDVEDLKKSLASEIKKSKAT